MNKYLVTVGTERPLNNGVAYKTVIVEADNPDHANWLVWSELKTPLEWVEGSETVKV